MTKFKVLMQPLNFEKLNLIERLWNLELIDINVFKKKKRFPYT